MLIACPTCSVSLSCTDDMAGKKVKCANCGQRILVPPLPPQSKAGTNKTTLGKIIDEPPVSTVPVASSAQPPPAPLPPPLPPPPFALAAPDSSKAEIEEQDEQEEKRRKKKKRKRSSRYDDEFEDDYDRDYDDDWDDEREIRVRCPFCRKKTEPYIREQTSQQGWIIFAVLLFFFFPLCWIGILMKEKARFCRRCHSRLDQGARF